MNTWDLSGFTTGAVRSSVMSRLELPTCLATVAIAGAVATASHAQQTLAPNHVYPITSPVKDAGTFNVNTRRWMSPTRLQTQQAVGLQVIYDNTCTWSGGGMYAGTGSCEDYIDEGIIPGPGNFNFQAAGGIPALTSSANNVILFQFGYCTNFAVPQLTIGFYDSLGGSCAGGLSPTGPNSDSLEMQACPAAQTASGINNGTAYYDVGALGLPGDATPGGAGVNCWLLSAFLGNTGFCLQSDGEGVWDNNADADRFNWSWQMNNVQVAGTAVSGIIIAGEPLSSPGFGACTYNIPCAADAIFGDPCGTGFGQDDAFWINIDQDPAGTPNTGIACISAPAAGTGCYWFGGYPGDHYGGFWMRMIADGSCTPGPLCVDGGAGGAVPVSGTGGGGAWPSTLPPWPLVSVLAVTLPPGASVLKSVRLNGFSHTFIGDLHLVLQDPFGGRHTILHRPNFTGSGNGCGGDFNGNYEIVDANVAYSGSCGASGFACPSLIPAGTYRQTVGAWPSGTGGILNTPLESIPISPGTWRLHVYDWASIDVGTLASWELCFGDASPPVTSFPPAITTPPTAQAVCAGSGASFLVVATGTPAPTYQWRKNGVSIPGATSSSYSIASVTASDAGSYSCSVSNVCGTITSSSAVLTVDSLDSDGDGTADCNDGCPSDPLKIAAGACGCGVADSDLDLDGTADCNDGCPADPNKIAPGICGCGFSDNDSDGDGTLDCNDGCPNDPLKVVPMPAGVEIPHIVDLSTVPGSAGNGTLFSGLVCRMGLDSGGGCLPGYLNNTSMIAFKTFMVSSGDRLSYDFRCESEPGADVTTVMLITTGTCPDLQCDCTYSLTSLPNERVTLATFSGGLQGSENIDLSLYAGLTVCIVINAESNATGSDSDCGFNTDDGQFEFDNIRVGADLTTFDDGADGWTFGALTSIAPPLDTDGDGTSDCNDGCPLDPLKIAPGQCGCGILDTDSDGDGLADCNDGCPLDPLKIVPGNCGCGISDIDTDGDLTPDCSDGCPLDPLKIAPGICGCGVADMDSDGDTISDCVDNCPLLANPGQEDCDGDGPGDACEIAAGTQLDVNGNMVPDDCEPGQITTYCTAGTTTNGCNPVMSATGTPSASAPSGFTLVASNLEGQKQGIIFYGINGPVAVPWGFGSSYLCVKAPTQRMSTQSSGGTAGACDGVLAQDWNAFITSHPTALGQPFVGGETVWAQAWFRDPPAPKTTNLSNGLEFVTQP